MGIMPGYRGGIEMYTINRVSIIIYTGWSRVWNKNPFKEEPWVIARMKHYEDRAEDYRFYQILGNSDQVASFKLMNNRYFDEHGNFYTSHEYMCVLKTEVKNEYIVKLDNIEFKLGRPNSHLYDLYDQFHSPHRITFKKFEKWYLI